MSRIYLDYNATAPLLPAVRDTVCEMLEMGVGNASAVHGCGRQTRQFIEHARNIVAEFCGVSAARVVFLSGATEANHLALQGFSGPVIVSAAAHPSVRTARADAAVCGVDANGCLDLNQLEMLLKKQSASAVVSIITANNETGIIQPMADLVSLCKNYGALIHADAVQSVGRHAFLWSDVDMISLSAHKIGGLMGVGALILPEKSSVIQAMLKGGGQERSYRSGTENVMGIVSMGAALLQKSDWVAVQQLRDALEEMLVQKGARIVGQGAAKRLPNTIAAWMPGVPSAIQVMHFDLNGVSVSAGSACSSGKVKKSAILQAMGLCEDAAASTIRLSLGPQNTLDEMKKTAEIWGKLYDHYQLKQTDASQKR